MRIAAHLYVFNRKMGEKTRIRTACGSTADMSATLRLIIVFLPFFSKESEGLTSTQELLVSTIVMNGFCFRISNSF